MVFGSLGSSNTTLCLNSVLEPINIHTFYYECNQLNLVGFKRVWLGDVDDDLTLVFTTFFANVDNNL